MICLKFVKIEKLVKPLNRLIRSLFHQTLKTNIMKNFTRPFGIGTFAALTLLATSCSEDPSATSTADSQQSRSKKDIPEMTFYALAGGLILDQYSTSDPEDVVNSVQISGLQSNETILSIDFRPATGELYGLGSSSRIYVINQDSGAARAVSPAPFSPALEGSIAGFDFNPTVDRIRVVTSSGQNFRLNPETGALAATDLAINGASGAVIAAVAYTNNVAGAMTTTLYDIDTVSDKLYKQNPPNNGTLVEVGSLGLNIEGEGGFDISHENDLALGLFESSNKSNLFLVDLNTGNTVTLAKYSKTMMYTGIAIPTRPVAYAVNDNNEFLIFNPENTSTVTSKPITGLAAGEKMLGIDFRPLNGQIFGVGSTSRLYTINASSGAATPIGSPFTIALSGTHFGVDFNPLVDRIRIVSNTGQNLRVNPADGAVIVDLPLNPGSPMISGAAYANNFAGTTSTILYDIDVNTDKLYVQNPPNAGTLVEIGPLGVNATAGAGFDIGGRSGIPYAVLSSGGSTSLYTINKATGAATLKGPFSSTVNGFTVGLGF
jgi:hypothetical protein